jgi:hypothetical protein
MGRKCAVAHLPPELMSELQRKLADKAHGGYSALSRWLGEHGYKITSTALKRYDKKMQPIFSRAIEKAETARRLIVRMRDDDGVDYLAESVKILELAYLDTLEKIEQAKAEHSLEQRLEILAIANRGIHDLIKSKAYLLAIIGVTGDGKQQVDEKSYRGALKLVKESMYGISETETRQTVEVVEPAVAYG